MDFRTALPNGYELCVQDQNGGVLRYIIQKEIGRGGSCIVYDAIHQMNTGTDKHVRIKECYPFKLKIDRNSDQSLQIIPAEAEEFGSYIRKMKSDNDMLNQLFEKSLSDSITELWDIYEGNQTVYSVFTFSSGKTLLSDIPKSLKKCLGVVRKIAYVIGRIHESGYLYLDVKPENILIEHGQTDRVLFCDFDSLFPITRESSADVSKAFRLSYSPHYAPIELITSQKKQLGPWTDVYSIGVLLFHLLFDRFPTMLDCMQNAEYDFSKIRPEYVGTYRDRLFFALADFFGKTLAPFYKSRYSSMQEVEQKISDLEKLADLETPYICSTKIIPPTRLFARESELTQMNAWIEKKDPVLCISGLGGIGKSALVQKFLDNCRKDSDAILYLQYHDSLKETISDDFFAKINTVEKNPLENGNQYYRRKLKAFKDCVGERSIIAIDNFVWNESDDLNLLLDVGWRVILISREVPPTETFPQIVISPLPDDGQRELFEYNLGRPLQETEIVLFQKIADLIQGHTLVLELIAKQIVASFLSLEQAAELIEQKSISEIAPESVNYEKDGKIHQNKQIRNIIAGLFDFAGLSEDERALLKAVSLFHIPVEIDLIQKALNLESKDLFHRLKRLGFLEIHDCNLDLHPIVREAIRQWEWTKRFEEAVNDVLLWFDSFFFIDLPKQYMDKKELNRKKKIKNFLLKPNVLARATWRKFEKTYKGRRFLRAILFCDTPASAEFEKCNIYLAFAESILKDPNVFEQFGKSETFLELDYYVTIRRHSDDIQQLEQLLKKPYYKKDHLTKLLFRLISLYIRSGNIENAKTLLARAGKEFKKIHSETMRGEYFYHCGGLYLAEHEHMDTIENQKEYIKKAEKSFEKAFHYFRKGKDPASLYLALSDWSFYLFGEAFSNNHKKDEIHKKIRALVSEIKRAKEAFAFPSPDVEIQYLRTRIITCAILEEETDSIEKDAIKLRELLTHCTISDDVKVDKYYFWVAISLFNIGAITETKKWIADGIAICDKNLDNPLFVEGKKTLMELLDDL